MSLTSTMPRRIDYRFDVRLLMVVCLVLAAVFSFGAPQLSTLAQSPAQVEAIAPGGTAPDGTATNSVAVAQLPQIITPSSPECKGLNGSRPAVLEAVTPHLAAEASSRSESAQYRAAPQATIPPRAALTSTFRVITPQDLGICRT